MTGSWEALLPKGIRADLSRIDPYLWLADAGGYVDHLPALAAGDESLVLDLALEVDGPRPPKIELTALDQSSAFFTGRATRAQIVALLGRPKVKRLLLAQPLMAQRAPPPWMGAPKQVGKPTAEPAPTADDVPEVLLAVIDTGCPFAHQDLRRGASDRTRVVRLWDQGSGADHGGLGSPPTGWGYGTELTGADLDHLIQSTRSRSAAVDEHACYLAAGHGSVLGRGSHGAHALGMLAASRRWNARPSPAIRQPQVPGKQNEPSRHAEVVFVQLPHGLTTSVSVRALEARALDAFRYILEQAMHLRPRKPGAPRRVVVSFGYESWVGPHDGTSWFERALDSLVDEAKAAGVSFKVHLIAGNGRDRHVHAAAAASQKQMRLKLRLPPANEAPTFVEIWAPKELSTLRFTLMPPGRRKALPPIEVATAAAHGAAWPSAARPQASVVMQQRSVLSNVARQMILLRLAPTRVTSPRYPAAAQHGIWTLQVSCGAGETLVGVDAYVCRSQASPGLTASALQPCFVGRRQKQDRRGTLNGHAGGKHVVVSGASFPEHFRFSQDPHERASKRAAPYSGAGNPRNVRTGPDDTVVVEESLFHRGTLGMGNRSGSLLRLSGTSVAAPCRARFEVDQFDPVHRKAGPPNPRDPEMGRADPLDPVAT